MEEHSVTFGKTEKESPAEYNHLTADLILKIEGSDKKTEISFNIKHGFPVGQFDMERQDVSYNLSIKETERLIEKLNVFVANAKKFSETF